MRKLLPLLLVLYLTYFQSSIAQNYAVSLKASTLGFGVEGMRSFNPNFNARIGFAFFGYNLKGGGGSKDDYSYEAKLSLTGVNILADYFPWKTGLRVTAGFLINLNKITTEMTPTKTYVVGGDVYTLDLLGKMNGEIKFNKISPYFGIGFGNPIAAGKKLGFTFDIGTMYHGSPKVDLSASGLIEPSASPEQEEKLVSNLSWFKWYPIISFGLTYQF
jgi:hypothetical protein